MKIGQVAPLYERVLPRFYGGTEQVVSYLTEALVAQGHDVTLFASSDSLTNARLIAACNEALRLNPQTGGFLPCQIVQLEQVHRHAEEFDVLHFHIDLIHFPLVQSFATPALTTLHGRLDLPELKPFYSAFCDAPLVSISDAQRSPVPRVNWMATVPHGLPRNLLPFSPTAAGGYFSVVYPRRNCRIGRSRLQPVAAGH